MKHIATVVDDFLNKPEKTRAEILKKSEFQGETSPFDGLYYPNISVTFPKGLLDEWKDKTEEILNRKIIKSFSILRQSKAGYNPYQFVHHDSNILPEASILFLNDAFPENAGTALMRSKENHFAADDESPYLSSTVNTPPLWQDNVFVAMKFNRMFYFKSKLYHQARPPSGFGETKDSARLIFISWFSVK